MNWQPLLAQVEDMMLASEYSLTEFKAILSTTDWYKREPFRKETWWFGRGAEKSEQTFEQLHGLFGWMGLDKPVIMEAMRYNIVKLLEDVMKEYGEDVAEAEGQRDLTAELEGAA